MQMSHLKAILLFAGVALAVSCDKEPAGAGEGNDSLSKNKEINTVGKLGIVPAFFGISEPITFGLPIMLNPILFIPSILTSIVNCAVTYALMSANIIHRTYAMLSYNMPSIFGAYFAPHWLKRWLISNQTIPQRLAIFTQRLSLSKENEYSPGAFSFTSTS